MFLSLCRPAKMSQTGTAIQYIYDSNYSLFSTKVHLFLLVICCAARKSLKKVNFHHAETWYSRTGHRIRRRKHKYSCMTANKKQSTGCTCGLQWRYLNQVGCLFDQPFGVAPAEARVGDGLAVNMFADLLAAAFEVRLDHEALNHGLDLRTVAAGVHHFL